MTLARRAESSSDIAPVAMGGETATIIGTFLARPHTSTTSPNMSHTTQDWNERYLSGDVPWDSGRPSRELIRVLDEHRIPPCRALELGCGTGTNAILLASRGFQVTAVDGAPEALHRAREKAAAAGVEVDFVEQDVCAFGEGREPYDFLFDRGCYHAVRRTNRDEFLQMLARVTRPGSRFLALTGNANEQATDGPPRLTEDEIRAELGALFTIDALREFRFQEPDGSDGPLAWSCLMTRHSA